MISTRQDRLESIFQTFRDADENFAKDLSLAVTAAQAAAVQSNRATVERAYRSALEATLGGNGPAVESALIAAQDALTAVERARETRASIGDLVARMNHATQTACDLLRKATQ